MRKAWRFEARHCPPIANVRKRNEAEYTASQPAFRIGVVVRLFFFSMN